MRKRINVFVERAVLYVPFPTVQVEDESLFGALPYPFQPFKKPRSAAPELKNHLKRDGRKRFYLCAFRKKILRNTAFYVCHGVWVWYAKILKASNDSEGFLR
ncbi:hypothetical protein QE152_g37304 [Popillia japonica]|uniref:Uncharacterized protein n=1 Tax=Popillia japonica TaxID=7064 RepID=A0AAW1IAW3_POPJA